MASSARSICRNIFKPLKVSNYYLYLPKNGFSTSYKSFSKTIDRASWGKFSKIKKIALISAAGCLVVGGLSQVKALAYPESRTERKYYDEVDGLDVPQEAKIPDIIPSRKVAGPLNVGLKVTILQYQTCPFCCKVRAFLDFYGIPYDVVEVNPVLRQQLKFSKYRKVPILLVRTEDGQFTQLNDSSAIVSILATYLQRVTKNFTAVLSDYEPITYTDQEGKDKIEILNKYNIMFGEEIVHREIQDLREEREWRQWVDDDLVHVLSPNIYRSRREAKDAFKYFSEVGEWETNFPTWERYLAIYGGATAMYFVGKRLKKRHRLKEDVRESLYDASRTWTRAIGPDRLFMGGDTPNLADLAVYGVLNAIEGCDAFRDLLQYTKIGPWYYRVQKRIKEHDGSSTVVVAKKETSV